MADHDPVLIDLSDGVQTLTLNQPAKFNALSGAMVPALGEAMRAAERDATVRAIVLTGAGKGFCSGADISEFNVGANGAMDPGDALRKGYNPLITRVRTMEKPILAAVNSVLPDDQVLTYTQELAARLAHGPVTTLGLIKRAVNQAHELPLERVLEMEANYQTIAARDPNFAEGVAAFREKRTPRFNR